jgi:hypothetical protein
MQVNWEPSRICRVSGLVLADYPLEIVLRWQNVLAQAANRWLRPKSRPVAAWQQAQRRSVVSKVLIPCLTNAAHEWNQEKNVHATDAGPQRRKYVTR